MDLLDDLVTLLPELIMAALVLVIITTDLFLPRSMKWVLTWITVAGLVLVALCLANDAPVILASLDTLNGPLW